MNGRIIHQMWRPEGEAYAERREGPFGEPITVATVEGITVDTSAL